MTEVPLCDRHKRINEEGWTVGESKLDAQHKEYHHQLFRDPEKRRDVTQCPMCGFFSLPYEPIFYQDTREGIEWAEWAYNAWLEDQKQKRQFPSDLEV